MELTIRDLPPGDAAWDEAFDVLNELHGDLQRDEFAAVHRAGTTQGLTFTAAFDEAGHCLGVCGWRLLHSAKHRLKAYVDDLSVSGGRRSTGVGAALLDHVADRAARMGCHALDLDCAVHRTDAHRFYEREGMTMTARHYRRPLTGG